MKQIKYILIFLAAALVLQGCAEGFIDRRMEENFVTFDTKNGATKSLSITEGDEIVVGVSVAATRGSSMTVNFEVVIPENVPVSATLYELYTMDGAPMTSNVLTFPNGTGTQQFIFKAVDNDDIDGNRTFTLKLTGNSKNYRMGVREGVEGETMEIAVRDDEVVITPAEFLGTWELSEAAYYSSAWHEELYNVTFTGDADNFDGTFQLVGLAQDETVVVNGTVDLASKVKTLTIPGQKIIPTWNSGYDTWIVKRGPSPGWSLDPIIGTISKDDSGDLTIDLSPYMVAAVTIGADFAAGFQGYFYQTDLPTGIFLKKGLN